MVLLSGSSEWADSNILIKQDAQVWVSKFLLSTETEGDKTDLASRGIEKLLWSFWSRHTIVITSKNWVSTVSTFPEELLHEAI